MSAPAGTTLFFVCAIHPWMQGELRVKEWRDLRGESMVVGQDRLTDFRDMVLRARSEPPERNVRTR